MGGPPHCNSGFFMVPVTGWGLVGCVAGGSDCGETRSENLSMKEVGGPKRASGVFGSSRRTKGVGGGGISGAYHFFDNMVDAHRVRDEGGFTLQWLVVAFHWVRFRVGVYRYIYNLKSMPTILSNMR